MWFSGYGQAISKTLFKRKKRKKLNSALQTTILNGHWSEFMQRKRALMFVFEKPDCLF